MSGREFPGRINPDFSFITSMVVSGYAICQANSCSPLVHTQADGGGIMLWGTFAWAALGPLVVIVRSFHGLFYLNIIQFQCTLTCGSSCTLTWRLSPQLEMESSSRTTPHVARLGLCWSGSRSILMNST
ncbi:hypothetical protein AVEN_38985-1 [Araneus ventricosus]|uniref:Uncharacterized protein n=1 Tax=Araneus ventricosus TaxID=182803 RepID=A0A4Y2KKT4_ARAVE|nr:hypothetical protein AVEN_38985-1 [Araneus ventricosus]